jgi:hypothetical protein
VTSRLFPLQSLESRRAVSIIRQFVRATFDSRMSTEARRKALSSFAAFHADHVSGKDHDAGVLGADTAHGTDADTGAVTATSSTSTIASVTPSSDGAIEISRAAHRLSQETAARRDRLLAMRAHVLSASMSASDAVADGNAGNAGSELGKLSATFTIPIRQVCARVYVRPRFARCPAICFDRISFHSPALFSARRRSSC